MGLQYIEELCQYCISVLFIFVYKFTNEINKVLRDGKRHKFQGPDDEMDQTIDGPQRNRGFYLTKNRIVNQPFFLLLI